MQEISRRLIHQFKKVSASERSNWNIKKWLVVTVITQGARAADVKFAENWRLIAFANNFEGFG